jgi:excisionase family DNA binding protein
VEERLNDVKRSARRLSVSPWTVKRMIADRRIKGVRVGRRVPISESELLKIMRDGVSKKGARAGTA